MFVVAMAAASANMIPSVVFDELDDVPDLHATATASVPDCGQLFFKIHNLLNLHQEPAVDLGEVEDLVDGEAGAEGVANEEDAFGVGHAQFATNNVARKDVAVAVDFRADAPRFDVAAQADAADFEGAQAFLEALLERAPDGHRFAHALHLRGQRGIGLVKFLEGEPRDLGDDVINRRLEAGRRFARDV